MSRSAEQWSDIAQYEVNPLLTTAARRFARFRFVLWEQNRVVRRTKKMMADTPSVWSEARMEPTGRANARPTTRAIALAQW